MGRIVIIDDDAEMRSLLKSMFESAGHEVALAVDGKEGISLHRSQPADLIVTDIFMPNQDGFQTIIEVRRDSPEVPIIAMSGRPGLSHVFFSTARQLGAVRVIEKPFQPHELLAAVEEVLKA